MGDVEQRVRENLNKINRRYASFVQCIKTSIKEKRVETSDLRSYLMNMSSFFCDDKQEPVLFTDLEEELLAAKNIDEIFMLISKKYASFLDFEIFQSMIDDYNIDTGQEKLNYETYLEEYLKKQKISEFIDINPQLKKVTKGTKIVLKLNVNTTRSLIHIVDIKRSIAKILGLQKSAIRIYDVKKGCVLVTLLIPTATAGAIFYSEKEFTTEEIKEFQALSILWLECNGTIIKFKEVNLDDQININEAQSGKL